MLVNHSRLIAKSKDYVTKLMESVAVMKTAVGGKRVKLDSLHQDHDKPLTIFATCSK